MLPFHIHLQDAADITLLKADWLVSSCLKAYNEQPETLSCARHG